MGNENLKSAGTQFTPRGIIPGVVVVSGSTGMPNDAVNPLFVDVAGGAVSLVQPVTSVVQLVRHDYSSANVTTLAYTQLVASTSGIAKRLEIFDSSGQTLVLATGASSSEADLLYVFPGGNGPVQIDIPAGTRLSIKAVSSNATVGELDINIYNIA